MIFSFVACLILLDILVHLVSTMVMQLLFNTIYRAKAIQTFPIMQHCAEWPHFAFLTVITVSTAIIARMYADRSEGYSWVYGGLGFGMVMFGLIWNWKKKRRIYSEIKIGKYDFDEPVSLGFARGATHALLAGLIIYPVCYWAPLSTPSLFKEMVAIADWITGFVIIRWVFGVLVFGILGIKALRVFNEPKHLRAPKAQS